MHNFDPVVTGAIDIAYSEALARKNPQVSAAHLLWGLVQNPKSVSRKHLKNCQKQIKDMLDQKATAQKEVPLDQIRPEADFSKWITLASSDAIQSGKQAVSEAELLKHLKAIFPKLSYDPNVMEHAEEKSDDLNFLVNLGELASAGKIDPVIGRTKEIRAVMEILGRRSKNNPILVGPAGVGKTAIVEGLALAIHRGRVPDVLLGKTVFALDMGALMAGTKYRGDFEERIQKMLHFLKEQHGEAILFIDEIHQLVGAGRTDGAMDAANLLKPALARGEISCIGATTEAEFQKYILGDSALERRFRPVPVGEPSLQDAVEILMGIKEKLEIHHGITITDEAIYGAVALSDQYLTDKQLPDKAIDLLDEAASALKLSAEAMPTNLVELEAEIRSKSIYAEVDKANDALKPEIEELKKEFEAGKAAWQEEVLKIKKMSVLKNQIDQLKFELEKHELKGEYEKASELKYAKIPALEKQLTDLSVAWELQRKDIAQVIARQTGIPLAKILKSKQDQILELESYLTKTVFGQEKALHEISETLIAAHAGLSDESRPLGSFLLLGPSGVGKTETVKAISRFLYQGERSLVRLDLSEYSEKHSVAKLIGAPAGYVGYDEGGILTEAIRKRPYSVILFDEIEKAHPDFADILLQILDDGRLTDNKGRVINFKNTVIFLTSNSTDIERDFKPELLGRLDAILRYESLKPEAMDDIIQKNLTELNNRLKDKNVVLKLDSDVRAMLAERGFSQAYGARPLAALFNSLIIRPLAHQLLTGKIASGTLTAHSAGREVSFSQE